MYSFVGIVMRKNNIFRKVAIIVMLTSALMLAGCGSDEASKEANEETTTIKKVVERETTTKEVVIETTEANEETTVVAIKPWKYKYKGKKFVVSNELIANKIMEGLKIEVDQTVFANDFVDEDVDAGDLLRGEFVYQLLEFMGMDSETFKIDHDGGRDTILLPYSEEYSFTNTTGKSFFIEYVGVDDIDYYFDFYVVN